VCKVLNDFNDVLCTLEDSKSFGEIALYGRMMRRTATVIAASYCDLDVLLKSDFLQTVCDFPDMERQIVDKAKDVAKELKDRGLSKQQFQTLTSERLLSSKHLSENNVRPPAQKRGSTMIKVMQGIKSKGSTVGRRLSTLAGMKATHVTPAVPKATHEKGGVEDISHENNSSGEKSIDPVQALKDRIANLDYSVDNSVSIVPDAFSAQSGAHLFCSLFSDASSLVVCQKCSKRP
jgi:hypothetical protein